MLLSVQARAREALDRLDGKRPSLSPTRAKRRSATTASQEAAVALVDTDVANARRLVMRHGPDLRHVHGVGWLVWDGRRFARDVGNVEIMRRAQDTADAIWREEAPAATDVKSSEQLLRWAKISGLLPRLRAMVELAASLPEVARTPADLDADPILLNVANGTLDLRTGELRPHDRADLITKIADVPFDPAATSPRWIAFLDETFCGDEALIAFMRCAIGYSLTGNTTAQKFFLCIGEGGHGKGVIQRVGMHMLGDYAMQANFDTFLASKYGRGGSSYDLAGLAGARWIGAGEPPKGAHWDEARLKAFTGEDPIRAAFKYGAEFQYTPVGKLWFLANDPPTTRDTGESMRRRLLLIPFTAKIDDDRKNEHLTEELLEEASGILAWAVVGAALALENGLKAPASVRLASEEYLADADAIQRFLIDCCRVQKDDLTLRVTAKALHLCYERWCADDGAPGLKKNAFGRDLVRRGFKTVRSSAALSYLGIELFTAQAPESSNNDAPNEAMKDMNDSGGKTPYSARIGVSSKTLHLLHCFTEPSLETPLDPADEQYLRDERAGLAE